MSVPLDDAASKLDDLSDRISTRVRTLSLSVLAVAWLFISKDKTISQLSISDHQSQLAFIALFGILAVGFDLMQYQCGYWYTYRLLRDAEDSSATSIVFDKTRPAYRWRLRAFYIKQGFAVVAAIWLFTLLAISTLCASTAA